MYYAAKELSHLKSQAEWIDNLENYWRDMVDIAGGAIMDAQFDVYIVDEGRRQIVLDVARKVLEKFRGFGEKIPISVLESMEMSGTFWVHDPPTEGFINASQGLINLLEGRVVADNPAMPMWLDSR